MRILITGGRGYLGSVLVPLLLAVGHEVVSLVRSADTSAGACGCLPAAGQLVTGQRRTDDPRTGHPRTDAPCTDRPLTDHPCTDHPRLSECAGDIRDPDPTLLADVDTVLCLAAVPNNPLAAQNLVVSSGLPHPHPPSSPPALEAPVAHPRSSTETWSVNRDAAADLARAARTAGVSHFVFASSCSIYGVSDKTPDTLDEDGPLTPVSAYAAAKAAAEDELSTLAAPDFTVTMLRLATLFGPSPRFRPDLLVNAMVTAALTQGWIPEPARGLRRPVVHVRDAAEAFALCVASPPTPISPVGPTSATSPAVRLNVVGGNVRTDELARHIATTLRVPTRLQTHADDPRDYSVSAHRFEHATGRTHWRTVDQGVEEMRALLTAGAR